LREWHLDPTGTKPPMAWMPEGASSVRDGIMPGMATPQQLKELQDAKGKNVDILFLQLMQQHHLGGIHMAQSVIDMTDDEEVQEVAEMAVNSQQRELTDIRTLMAQVQRS
jgi:uncharacterized protein (DUF305 family)